MVKALEKDREFQYSLIGLFEFEEILNRIARVEEKAVEVIRDNKD